MLSIEYLFEDVCVIGDNFIMERFQCKEMDVCWIQRYVENLLVHNEGSRTGATTCRLTDAAKSGYGAVAVVQTPRVDGGQTREFTTTVRELGTAPLMLKVECDSP